jgi:hypothetical protein
MKQHIKTCRLPVAFLALALPSLAAAQQGADANDGRTDPGVLRFSTGINYSSGDYGDTRKTKVISAPVGLKYSKGPLSLRFSIPYVRISGPGSLIQTPEGRDAGFGGGDSGRSSNSGSGSSNSGSGSSNSGSGSSGSSGSGSGGSSGSGSSGSGSSGSSGGSSSSGGTVAPGAGAAQSSRRSGIGDASIALSYELNFGSEFYADVSGKVKIPTASKSKRIGTGKVDITAGLDLVKDIGNASIYAGGRRRFSGKPAGSALRSVWGAGAGASVRASDTVSVGMDYDWQQSSFAGSGGSSEVTGWANFRVAPKVQLQVYAGTGFTTNSADIVGGLSLSWRLN